MRIVTHHADVFEYIAKVKTGNCQRGHLLFSNPDKSCRSDKRLRIRSKPDGQGSMGVCLSHLTSSTV
jgi:hypothetical protein